MQLQEFIKIEQKPIADLIASKKIPKVCAAALTYITDEFIALSGQSKHKLLESIYKNKPDIFALLHTNLGDIALIIMPLLPIDLYANKDKLNSLVAESLQLAKDIGSQVISLTGLIPSATNNGNEILKIINDQNNIQLTTGLTTTYATIALSLQRLLLETNRDITKENICILGMGQMGKVILELILKIFPHPKSITLCGIYENMDILQQVKKNIKKAAGFKKNIELIKVTGGRIPEQLYKCTLIISAVNIPNTIDISQLSPGTLVIDNLTPYCFSIKQAIERMNQNHDVLLTGGGILESPVPIKRTIRFKNISTDVFRNHNNQLTNVAQITGCILSGLLSAKFKGLKPITGDTTLKDSHAHFLQLNNLGFKGGALHLGDCVITKEHIDIFRNKFGNL